MAGGNDKHKTKAELIEELDGLKRRLAGLAGEGVMRAILESTADGILVVGGGGEVIHSNARFTEMWRIPGVLLAEGDDDKLLAFVLDQLSDPEAFLDKVRELYQSSATDFDTLVFKDGRIFGRYSRPLMVGDEIKGRVWSFRDVTEQKKAERALKDSERKFRALFESAPEAIAIVDLDGRIIETNQYFGVPPEEIKGKRFGKLGFFTPDDLERIEVLFGQAIEEKYSGPFELRLFAGTGNERWVEAFASALKRDGEPYALQVICRDVTERKKLEEQFLQSQKMEAIGRLAGGVAHDFNNQLVVIQTVAEMIERSLDPDDPRLEKLDMIINAAEQSSRLTSQLLAFSRKQVIDPLSLLLNDALDNLGNMLGRLIGEDVDLSSRWCSTWRSTPRMPCPAAASSPSRPRTYRSTRSTPAPTSPSNPART